jgi:hypothetical protein
MTDREELPLLSPLYSGPTTGAAQNSGPPSRSGSTSPKSGPMPLPPRIDYTSLPHAPNYSNLGTPALALPPPPSALPKESDTLTTLGVSGDVLKMAAGALLALNFPRSSQRAACAALNRLIVRAFLLRCFFPDFLFALVQVSALSMAWMSWECTAPLSTVSEQRQA